MAPYDSSTGLSCTLFSHSYLDSFHSGHDDNKVFFTFVRTMDMNAPDHKN
jgi:hypothetical protein